MKNPALPRRTDSRPTLDLKFLSTQLRLAEHMSVTFGCAGEVVIFDFTKPERYWHVPDMARTLLSCFRCDRPTKVGDVVRILSRRYGPSTQRVDIDAASTLIKELIKIGVLVADKQRQGFYIEQMRTDYARAREVPAQICSTIIREGNIHRKTSVLDIGTGPGSIANTLGLASDHVIGADISDTFLDLARSMAQAMGSHAAFRRFDANKLLFSDEVYQVITASQMLHWLDPSWAVRGLYHGIVTAGSLFVVETKLVLRKEHPLRKLLGLGKNDPDTVIRRCARHAIDYERLFERFRPHDSNLNQRGVWIFRQRRSFDVTFARTYCFDSHIRAALPEYAEPWEAIQQEFHQISPEEASGEMYWLLLHFKKETHKHSYIDNLKICQSIVEDI